MFLRRSSTDRRSFDSIFLSQNAEATHPLPGAPLRFLIKGSNHHSAFEAERVAG